SRGSVGRVAADQAMLSPLPGIVRRVAVRVGERVEAGTVLVVVEAMKTEHRIGGPRAGGGRGGGGGGGREVAPGTGRRGAGGGRRGHRRRARGGGRWVRRSPTSSRTVWCGW